jgi:hypothetical protein
MSNDTATWHDELMAKCVDVASTVLGERDAIMEIRRGEPVMGRNYTIYYKVYLATLDTSGTNPTDQRCVVVSITSNRDSAKVEPSMSCDSVKELA